MTPCIMTITRLNLRRMTLSTTTSAERLKQSAAKTAKTLRRMTLSRVKMTFTLLNDTQRKDNQQNYTL